MSAEERPSAARWLFRAACAVYVLVLPMAGTTALRNLATALLVALTAHACVRRREFPRIAFPVQWLVYGAVALASLGYALDPEYSLGEIRSEFLYPLLVLAVAACWIRSEADLVFLAWTVAAADAVMVAGSFHLAATAPVLKTIGSLRTLAGTWSMYLVTVIPLIAALAWDCRRRGRRAAAAGLALLLLANGVAVFLTTQRQAGLALLVEILLVPVLWLMRGIDRRKLGVAALVALAAGAFFVLQMYQREPDESLGAAVEKDVRWETWRFSVDRIAEHPLAGAGFGLEAFKRAYPEFHRGHPWVWHAHNMVLNKGIQMGLPGIAAFLLLFGSVGWAFLRRREGPAAPWAWAGIAIVMGVLVRNMANDFFVRDGALLFWLICGALLAALGLPARRDRTAP